MKRVALLKPPQQSSSLSYISLYTNFYNITSSSVVPKKKKKAGGLPSFLLLLSLTPQPSHLKNQQIIIDKTLERLCHSVSCPSRHHQSHDCRSSICNSNNNRSLRKSLCCSCCCCKWERTIHWVLQWASLNLGAVAWVGNDHQNGWHGWWWWSRRMLPFLLWLRRRRRVLRKTQPNQQTKPTEHWNEEVCPAGEGR